MLRNPRVEKCDAPKETGLDLIGTINSSAFKNKEYGTLCIGLTSQILMMTNNSLYIEILKLPDPNLIRLNRERPFYYASRTNTENNIELDKTYSKHYF